MADGTRLKELQAQITKLNETADQRKADQAATRARLEHIESMLEQLSQQVVISPSSSHGGSNSHKDIGKQPFQM